MLIRMAIAHKRVAGDCGHDRFLEGCVSHRKNYDRIQKFRMNLNCTDIRGGIRHDQAGGRTDLASRLKMICEIDPVGRDRMKSGKFKPTEPAPVKKRKK